MKKHTTTIQFPDKKTYTRLANLAAHLGYTQTRGPGAGRLGSLSQLLVAIDRGEVRIYKKEE